MKSRITKMKLLISAGILLMSSSISAQGEVVVEEKERFNHSLGFGAGISTGYGLSYRCFGKKLGIQINFSPYKDEEKVIISSGLTFLYRIVELENISFFVYQANHFYFKEETIVRKSYDFDYVETVTTTFVKESYLNNGVGIGLEWEPFERIGVNVMGGYGGQENFRKVSFTGEGAIYFRF
jgi:hypothetical protein